MKIAKQRPRINKLSAFITSIIPLRKESKRRILRRQAKLRILEEKDPEVETVILPPLPVEDTMIVRDHPTGMGKTMTFVRASGIVQARPAFEIEKNDNLIIPTGIGILDKRLSGGFTRDEICTFFGNGVSYESKSNVAMAIALEVKKQNAEHFLSKLNADHDGKTIGFIGFDADLSEQLDVACKKLNNQEQ